MKVIIDATNIRSGGGLTHLKSLIKSHQSSEFKVEIIGGPWIKSISSSNYVSKIILSWTLVNPFIREIFKLFFLRQYLLNGDIAFIPGGTFSSKKVNYVTMSQNMLVFEEKERNRFPISFTRLRYLVLEKLQLRSFENSRGIIYISKYAKNFIENKYPQLKNKKSKVIYHGISNEFRQEPKLQKSINKYSKKNPYKITYISTINYYKHQWNVIKSVKELRAFGYNIHLDLIGPINNSLKSSFYKTLDSCDSFVSYMGEIPHEEISNSYKNTDLFIFASTCENMPNILIEAMSAGLPILCSNYGPMPEILKDAGVYMDPTITKSITKNLRLILDDENLRTNISKKAYSYSRQFSWVKSSEETFNFIKNLL